VVGGCGCSFIEDSSRPIMEDGYVPAVLGTDFVLKAYGLQAPAHRDELGPLTEIPVEVPLGRDFVRARDVGS
jgi:hypothetical protein